MTEQMTREQLNEILQPGLINRKCHTMGSLFTEKVVENGMTGTQMGQHLMRPDSFFGRAWANTPELHDQSQGTLAGLTDLANVVIDAPAPMAIGQYLVRKVDIGPNKRKFRIRDRGKSKSTKRGILSRGKGSTQKFVEVDPESEEESHETWDRNYAEDSNWDVAMEEAQAVSKAHMEDMSQIIMDKLAGISANSINSGGLHSMTGGNLSFDNLVDMRAKMLENNVEPNAVAASPTVMAKLVKDEAFQSSFRYGDFVDKRNGYIGMVFGMNVYQSSQIAANHCYMLDVDKTLICGVRRDAMMESYEEIQNGKKTYGIKVSTRYDLVEYEPKYFLRSENA
jgi:hypothetical protein